jgi:pilus assembly protein CpaB
MATGNDQKPARATDPAKSRIRALVFLVAAVVVALGTALLLTRYIETRIAAARVATEKVVVAAADISIATTLHGELLSTVDWPIASRPEGALRDRKDAEGRIVNVSLVKGEPILRSKLASGDAGRSALANLLPAGMRAMAVRVDDVVGVAGFVHPGDHVDVIVTMIADAAGRTTPTSKMILQNIKVMTVGRELEYRPRDPQKALPATVATLMVDSEQAERLALAASKGQIRLALRSSLDSDVVATAGVGPRQLLNAPVEEPKSSVARESPPAPPKTKKTVAVRKPATPPPPPSKVVEILRGDLFEKRDFQKESSK